MDNYLLFTGLTFLIIFSILSIIDGVYLHLIIYKLPEKNESKFEHITHTIRALLFIPTALTIFYWNTSGTFLWIALAVVALDLIVEAIDVVSERQSRSKIGGLSSGEYLLHVCLTTTRIAALSFFIAAKPLEAWSMSISLPQYPEVIRLIVLNLIPGSIMVALLHITLIFRPFFISEVESLVKKRISKMGLCKC